MNAISQILPWSPTEIRVFVWILWRLLKNARWISGVYRERHALAQLDDRLLADIGIGRDEAEREAGRSAFDLPQGRDGR